MAILLLGCATPQPPASSDAPPKPVAVTTTDYTIATLDRANITLANGDLVTLEVSQEGTVETPGGPKPARGQSKEAFVAMLRGQYPNAASIEVIEYRTDEISVLGEVFHQIHTTLGGGPMRLMDGIAAANGFTPLANKRRVKLVRQNAGVIKVYELDLRRMLLGQDIAQNMLLEPGDVISVPKNFL